MLTTNYKKLADIAPKRKKKRCKKSKIKLAVLPKIETVKALHHTRMPTERELLRKLDDWS